MEIFKLATFFIYLLVELELELELLFRRRIVSFFSLSLAAVIKYRTKRVRENKLLDNLLISLVL